MHILYIPAIVSKKRNGILSSSRSPSIMCYTLVCVQNSVCMLTKVYNKPVRVVKKTAPYTEFEHFVVNPVYVGEKFKSKEYISSELYELVQSKDYKLG